MYHDDLFHDTRTSAVQSPSGKTVDFVSLGERKRRRKCLLLMFDAVTILSPYPFHHLCLD